MMATRVQRELPVGMKRISRCFEHTTAPAVRLLDWSLASMQQRLVKNGQLLKHAR
jgi:hypothetical protein